MQDQKYVLNILSFIQNSKRYILYIIFFYIIYRLEYKIITSFIFSKYELYLLVGFTMSIILIAIKFINHISIRRIARFNFTSDIKKVDNGLPSINIKNKGAISVDLEIYLFPGKIGTYIFLYDELKIDSLMDSLINYIFGKPNSSYMYFTYNEKHVKFPFKDIYIDNIKCNLLFMTKEEITNNFFVH